MDNKFLSVEKKMKPGGSCQVKKTGKTRKISLDTLKRKVLKMHRNYRNVFLCYFNGIFSQLDNHGNTENDRI